MKLQAKNYTMSKQTNKKTQKYYRLQPTSQDSASAKTLAQLKRGLDIYMDNGNNRSYNMILKAI